MKTYRLLLGLLALLIVVGIIWQGPSWHFGPLYLALVLIAGIMVLGWERRKALVFGILGLLAGLSGFLFYAFPFAVLPAPEGGYPVGVTYHTLRTERDETMTADAGDKRTIYLKIWYPAQSGKQRSIYLEEGTKALDHLMGLADLPSFPFSQLAAIRTNSFSGAPMAGGTFPLLTFSHGYGSWFGQNTALMEELASRGNIVVGIAHSHQTVFAAEGEHKLVFFPEVIPLEEERDTAQAAAFERLFEEEKDRRAFDDFHYEYISTSESANRYAGIWSDDIVSTIDFIFAENARPASPFFGKIDSRRVGSVGMSFGGAASVDATLKDRRLRAAVNMDGTQFGRLVKDTARVPLLFMEAKRSPHGLSMHGSFFNRSKAPVYALLFQDAAHWNFTDVNLFSPVFGWIGLLGKVDGEFMIKSMNIVVPAFFESAFAGEEFVADRYLIEGRIERPVGGRR